MKKPYFSYLSLFFPLLPTWYHWNPSFFFFNLCKFLSLLMEIDFEILTWRFVREVKLLEGLQRWLGKERLHSGDRTRGFDTGLGGSLGGGNGNPLQYSCLERAMDKRSLAGYSPLGLKELYTTEVTEYACTQSWSKTLTKRNTTSSFPFCFNMASRQACPAILQSFPHCAAQNAAWRPSLKICVLCCFHILRLLRWLQ